MKRQRSGGGANAGCDEGSDMINSTGNQNDLGSYRVNTESSV